MSVLPWQRWLSVIFLEKNSVILSMLNLIVSIKMFNTFLSLFKSRIIKCYPLTSVAMIMSRSRTFERMRGQSMLQQHANELRYNMFSCFYGFSMEQVGTGDALYETNL